MKLQRLGLILVGLIAIGLFTLSFFNDSFFLFILGTFLLLISIFLNIFLMVIDLYRKDKEFNIEKLQDQGLTIINCKICNEVNVLEDQYCRTCGEKLEE